MPCGGARVDSRTARQTGQRCGYLCVVLLSRHGPSRVSQHFDHASTAALATLYILYIYIDRCIYGLSVPMAFPCLCVWMQFEGHLVTSPIDGSKVKWADERERFRANMCSQVSGTAISCNPISTLSDKADATPTHDCWVGKRRVAALGPHFPPTFDPTPP